MYARVKPALALVSLLLVGTAAPVLATHGTWMGATGMNEPNSEWDTPGFMFQVPNDKIDPVTGLPVERIYFNGFVIRDDLLVSPADSHDVQIEGGSMLSPVSMRFAAMLGYWRDCNGDGYIGARLVPSTYGSFSVYDASLFTIDTALCPPGSPYWPINAGTGQANGYVDEFRWIGRKISAIGGSPGGPQVVEDPYDVSDPDAKVWVDWNFPGGSHIPHQGLTNQPPGTYDDSDGTLKYVDDASQLTLSSAPVLGALWGTKPNVGGCNDPPVFLGGPGGTCGVWPLFQVERVLSDRSNDGTQDPTPLVSVFDTQTDDDGNFNPCDDGFNQTIAGKKVAFAGLSPSADTSANVLVRGSLQGTVTNLYHGTGNLNFDGKCGSGIYGPDSPENNQLDAEFTHRVATDYLNFIPDARYRALANQGYDYAPGDLTGVGIRSGTVSAGSNNPGYFGTFGWTGRPPRTGFASVVEAFATFYADVSPNAFTNNSLASAATALPSAAQDVHVYGADNCTTFTTGASNVNAVNLWECSITVWEAKRVFDATGGGSNAPDPIVMKRAILGSKYDLRDVDCYDNTVSEEYLDDLRVGIANCAAYHS